MSFKEQQIAEIEAIAGEAMAEANGDFARGEARLHPGYEKSSRQELTLDELRVLAVKFTHSVWRHEIVEERASAAAPTGRRVPA
jgi:hypothetical protein